MTIHPNVAQHTCAVRAAIVAARTAGTLRTPTNPYRSERIAANWQRFITNNQPTRKATS